LVLDFRSVVIFVLVLEKRCARPQRYCPSLTVFNRFMPNQSAAQPRRPAKLEDE
jgi:hypothetical protein